MPGIQRSHGPGDWSMNSACTYVERAGCSAKSDGGSAFDKFSAGTSPKARSSGDPLIELLAFFSFRIPNLESSNETTDHGSCKESLLRRRILSRARLVGLRRFVWSTACLAHRLRFAAASCRAASRVVRSLEWSNGLGAPPHPAGSSVGRDAVFCAVRRFGQRGVFGAIQRFWVAQRFERCH